MYHFLRRTFSFGNTKPDFVEAVSIAIGYLSAYLHSGHLLDPRLPAVFGSTPPMASQTRNIDANHA